MLTRISNQRRPTAVFAGILLFALLFTACASPEPDKPPQNGEAAVTLETLPEHDGAPYVVLNGNVPAFSEGERTATAVEEYSPLDDLGRCGPAYANLCPELMPTEEREAIGSVKPTGWQTVRYDDLISDKYLYNRCHLIGYQLAGENANKQNLITGTRYLNVEGMLPFENQVADYIEETGNHVLYRVTPCFTGEELVARGVQMEALSVEDNGAGVAFNVYCYNVQPGITIDYATGDSWVAGEEPPELNGGTPSYILNTNSKKFHRPDCANVASIKPQNRDTTGESRTDLLARGYSPCGACKP